MYEMYEAHSELSRYGSVSNRPSPVNSSDRYGYRRLYRFICHYTPFGSRH